MKNKYWIIISIILVFCITAYYIASKFVLFVYINPYTYTKPFPYISKTIKFLDNAFDYAKDTTPITYGDGSRALTLNTKKDNIVSISGNSKDAAWWVLEDATAILTGIGEARRQFLPENHIFSPSGQRLSRLQRGLNIVNGKKIMIK